RDWSSDVCSSDLRPHVCELFYRLVRRLAGAVARTGLDAQHAWPCAEIGRLEHRDVLEGMCGNDTIVRVGGGDKERWIGHARPDIVQRRIAEQVLEICLRSEEHTSELQSRENLVCR